MLLPLTPVGWIRPALITAFSGISNYINNSDILPYQLVLTIGTECWKLVTRANCADQSNNGGFGAMAFHWRLTYLIEFGASRNEFWIFYRLYCDSLKPSLCQLSWKAVVTYWRDSGDWSVKLFKTSSESENAWPLHAVHIQWSFGVERWWRR